MRWHRHGHAKRTGTPAQAAAAATVIRGMREARMGTAAPHPGLVVTPDGANRRGSFVGDTFYEDRGTSFVQTPWQGHEEREREIAERAVSLENQATKDVWWLDRRERRPRRQGGWTVRGNR
jgi:hypothetical protein